LITHRGLHLAKKTRKLDIFMQLAFLCTDKMMYRGTRIIIMAALRSQTLRR